MLGHGPLRVLLLCLVMGATAAAQSQTLPNGFMTTPFVYDPTVGDDFIIQIEKCGTNAIWGQSLDGAGAFAGLNGGNRYGDPANCSAATSPSFNNEFVPIVRLGYRVGVSQACLPLPPDPYQTNQTGASMTISGVIDPGGFFSIQKSGAVNAPETLDLASTNVGLGWDIGLTLGVATSPSVLVTPGVQVVNLDLTSPALTFLNGGVGLNLLTTAFPVP